MQNGNPRRLATLLPTCVVSALVASLGGNADQALAQQPPGVAAPSASNAAEVRPESYVVKKGESLSGIAKRYGLETAQLAEWNAISDPKRLRVGQRLRLSPADEGSRKTGVAAAPAVKTKAPETPQPAGAASRDEELRSITGDLIVLLLQNGIISQPKAEALMKRAQLGTLPPEALAHVAAIPQASAEAGAPQAGSRAAHPSPAQPPSPGTEAAAEPDEVRVPYVPEIVKNEIRDQIKDEVMAQAKAEHWAQPSALPEWLDRISFYGDLRLRYQGNYFGPGNVPAPIYNGITGSDQTNTTENQSLFNYRARIGVKARVSDTVLADLRLSSGDADNPVSTNQNLGNYFNKSFISLDRAYIGWDPSERWAVLGGRTPNPFFSTDLVWDDDVNFDGFSGTFKPKFGADWGGFVTGGAYIVQFADPNPVTPDPRAKYLLGVQAGTHFNLGSKSRMKLALAYYDYQNIQGIPNPSPGSQINDWTVPLFKQKGNSLFNINSVSNPANPLYGLASEFGILDLNASADLAYFDPIVVRVYGDLARNLAFDSSEIRSRTGLNLNPAINAYKLGFTVGKAELANWLDWQAFFNYRYIEGDAVVDAFNDNNFHLGGTNAKGYEIGASLALQRNLSLRARWYSTDEVSGPPLAIDVFQLDFDARF